MYRNQWTVKRAGEIQDGSLRAQKMLKELSSDALEQTFMISGSAFLGFTQQRCKNDLNRARFPFKI